MAVLQGGRMPTRTPDTALSLFERLHTSGAEDAWQRLVTLYTPLLHAWLHRAGLQPADRDDLTQRVLEVLVRHLPEFTHSGRPGSFRAWLRGITVNLLREFWRRRPAAGSASVLEQLADSNAGLSRLWDEEHDRHVLHGLLEMVQPQFAETAWTAFRRLGSRGVSNRFRGKMGS
jgi:RNA polymerase sigma-70 factor (ECF subfamily)